MCNCIDLLFILEAYQLLHAAGATLQLMQPCVYMRPCSPNQACACKAGIDTCQLRGVCTSYCSTQAAYIAAANALVGRCSTTAYA